jgi:hypothetical protein
MINLDETTVLDLLDKAVAERGEEYRYVQPLIDVEIMSFDIYGNFQADMQQIPRCVYVDKSTGERQPSCLVGMALYLAGVPLEQLDVRGDITSTNLLKQLSEAGVVTATNSVYEIFRRAQGRQDQGESWRKIAVGERNALVRRADISRD